MSELSTLFGTSSAAQYPVAVQEHQWSSHVSARHNITEQNKGALDQDFARLIAQIAVGNEEAVSDLYKATNRLVFGLALRIIGDRETAEEVLLDVYTQVWRQAGRYDPKRGGPLSWLMTITRTRAIDRLRSEKLISQSSELTDDFGDQESSTKNPEQATVLSETQRLVRNALSSLSIEQREVIELSYFSGMTQAEIALHLRQPLGTVKTRTRLGMMRLRELLKAVVGQSL